MCGASISGSADPTGDAARIPASDTIPMAAGVFKFPTTQKSGSSGRSGEQPLFEVPDFAGRQEADLEYRTVEPFDLAAEP